MIYYRSLKKHSDNLYVSSPYGLKMGLYEVEIFYISNRLKSDNFKVYEYVELPNMKKYVYVRNLDNNNVYRIVIPKVKQICRKENVYTWRKAYIWKTKKGLREYYTSYRLYNRNAGRFYKVGDINKYGHVLLKITEKAFFVDTRDVLEYVGLNISI